MNSSPYIMREQAQNTVQRIMAGPIVIQSRDKLLLKPAWLGLILLVLQVAIDKLRQAP